MVYGLIAAILIKFYSVLERFIWLPDLNWKVCDGISESY